MMEMNQQIAEKWFQLFEAEIEKEKDHLSQLDTEIGDGDHGFNMARGVAAYQEAIEKKAPTTLQEVFKTMAMSLLSKVGGASGPLYGTAFMNMAKEVGTQEVLDDAGIAKMIASGLAGVKMRGKAEVGEKTMVDTWAPVVQALQAGDLTGQVIDDAVESTKPMKATKGRASYLGERSIGHIDAGATSSGILFKTMLEAING